MSDDTIRLPWAESPHLTARQIIDNLNWLLAQKGSDEFAEMIGDGESYRLRPCGADPSEEPK